MFLDSQSKIWLEDEYIKRYIGELTPLQESKLVQFKKQLSQLQKSKVIFYFISLYIRTLGTFLLENIHLFFLPCLFNWFEKYGV